MLDTTLCDKVCQCLAIGRWFSPDSSTNKTDRHDIIVILLKVALNTISLNLSLQLDFVLLVILLMNNVSNCISVDTLLSL